MRQLCPGLCCSSPGEEQGDELAHLGQAHELVKQRECARGVVAGPVELGQCHVAERDHLRIDRPGMSDDLQTLCEKLFSRLELIPLAVNVP